MNLTGYRDHLYGHDKYKPNLIRKKNVSGAMIILCDCATKKKN